MGLRGQRAAFIQLIGMQEKARNLTAAQAESFRTMVRRCQNDLELATVKQVVRDVSRGVSELTEVNLLKDDPLFGEPEEDDPPALREALARSQITFKKTA